MSKPRSNLKIAARVDAVVAATKIYKLLDAEDLPWSLRKTLPTGEPWMIIGCLRQAEISRPLIREWLNVILAVDLDQLRRWRVCWIRHHVGELETALGLDHDPRSAEALAAKAGGDEAWKAYTNADEPARAAREPAHA